MPDIAIIGGGPAGLTAGLYAARGGADAVLFEELFAGGQAAKTERIENYPGFPEGLDGYAVGSLIETQAARFGLNVAYEHVQALELDKAEKKIILADRTVAARAVILCMGASPRRLGVPDEERLAGAGISYCATCDGAFFRGADVAVVGGGDTAISDALYLARICASVTVVHRRDELRAADMLQKRAFAEEKIHFAFDSVVTALNGAEKLTGLTLKNVKTGELSQLDVAGAFVAVGVLPRTELVRGALGLAEAEAIPTDLNMAACLPGVFAAGDIRRTPLRQVITACSDGAIAATAALDYLQQAASVGAARGEA